jgi:hypothetical protein
MVVIKVICNWRPGSESQATGDVVGIRFVCQDRHRPFPNTGYALLWAAERACPPTTLVSLM